MVKKIFYLVGKIVIGIVVAYLILGFLVLPFALKWAAESQGTKFLGRPVLIRSVQFNPILLRLDVLGFQISGADKSPMVAFERLAVDVSFVRLLHKEYRVELVELDGFRVNIEFFSGGKINVMDLVPKGSVETSGVKLSSEKGVQAPVPAVLPPLPLVIVDYVVVRDGSVRFTDRTVEPNFSTTLGKISADVTGFSTKPDATTKVVFQGALDGKGRISSETLMRPLAQPLQLDTTFTLDDYALQVLSPYVGKYTGRKVGDGKLELRLSYRIADNKITAGHRLLVQKFAFGEKVESKDALGLPFGLAVALLEDSQGRINISLPVTGDMSKPDFHYGQLVGQVVRNFFMGLVTKPFAFLASALGAESGTDELGYVRFSPGRTDVLDDQKAKLTTLVKGLKDRPKLHLEVNGSYDLDTDWKAIKTDTLAHDYKDLRTQSTKSDSWIYQMLYQRRFGIRELWALTKEYHLKSGAYDEEKLDAEIKRQLVEKASPDKVALDALAMTRAKSVYNLIIAAGLDAEHVSIGTIHQVTSSVGFVPLEFTLTVYEKQEPALEPVGGSAAK